MPRLRRLTVSLILSLHWALPSACRVLGTRSTPVPDVPDPFSFPASQWDGIDGEWSSFALRVGTPSQLVRVFPSTAGYQTWVVQPAGCPSSTDFNACSESRGWLFDPTASSSWRRKGIFELWIEKNLGYSGNAEYGYDVVKLAAMGEGGPTLEGQIVGALAAEDHFLGLFGLNPRPTNFTNFNEPATSYMTSLRQQDLIPSVSFGYTAGAPYRTFLYRQASLRLC